MPLRKCLGCNKLKSTFELIKITKVYNTGDVIIQPDSKTFGRSSYICYNKECVKETLKKKRLQKTLKKQISDSIIKQLNQIVEFNQE